MSKNTRRNAAQSRLAVASTELAQPTETVSGTPAETITDEPSEQTEAPADAPSETSTDEPSETTTEAPATPALAPDVAEKLSKIDARIALLDTLLTEGKDERSELRKLRVALVGGTSGTGGGAGSKSGKSAAQRKSERTDYRFARRYAKKHGMSIEAARALLAEGKIAKQVRVSSTTVDEIAALRAELAAAHAALRGAGVSVDAQSHPDAEAMAAAIDAQIEAGELSEATV